MTEKSNPGGAPSTRKKYTPAFKAECVRQVAAGARQSDVARAQGLSPALLGRWCYLATWRDACYRCVIGCHLAARMPPELALTALEQALTLRPQHGQAERPPIFS